MDPMTMSALASLGSAGMSSGGNFLSQYFTNKQNKELQQNQQDWDVKMWNMSNVYNTPSAQMERYKQAGLNPNLIYGSGSASSGNAPPVHTESPAYYHAPPVSMPDIGGIMNNYASYKNQMQDLEKKKWDTATSQQIALDQAFQNMIKYGSSSGKLDHAESNGDLYWRYGGNAGLELDKSRGWRSADLNIENQRLQNVGTDQSNRIRTKIADSYYYKMVIDSLLGVGSTVSKFMY